MLQTVTIDKLVHGGQALGLLSDGRKVLAWNALPGETVGIRLTKSKNKYAEGIAEEILQPSPDRIEPRDEAYLSTSPWQMMTYEAENKYKKEILGETFMREKVQVPGKIEFHTGESQWHYRNKMEYSFWADDKGLHLALFHRGSHAKRIVSGSSIAMPEIDSTAKKILAVLNKAGVRGSQLKTVVIRCSQASNTVAALFVKDKNFPKIEEIKSICKGIAVYYSNPKSPASIITKELYKYGDITLSDKIMGVDITYDVNSFFQVNISVFEWAAKRIDYFTGNANPKVDFYSGVGTIGLPVNATTLIESDEHNIAMAKLNADWRPVKIIQAPAEKSLEYISSEGALIVDPPRSGLHTKLVNKIREARPPLIAYLSCNPITQARDLALLQDIYKITNIEGYNFFPRTPHIESLAILNT
jgi:23S rRNA (uracil1939-C5)-methyltransferase